MLCITNSMDPTWCYIVPTQSPADGCVLQHLHALTPATQVFNVKGVKSVSRS